MPEYERLGGGDGSSFSWRALTKLEKWLIFLCVLLGITVFTLTIVLIAHKSDDPIPVTTTHAPAPTTKPPAPKPTTKPPIPTTKPPAPKPTTKPPAPKPTTNSPEPTTKPPAPKPTTKKPKPDETVTEKFLSVTKLAATPLPTKSLKSTINNISYLVTTEFPESVHMNSQTDQLGNP